MKRAGCLLFATLPVLVTAIAYLVASDHPDSDIPMGSGASAAPSSRQEAKAAAEDPDDDAAVAAMPPGLAAPKKKELAGKIVASAVNSTLDWRTTYGSVKDIGDGQGYTAGIVGFCTGTHDLLTLVERYTEKYPGNGLARYLPALRTVDGTDSHEGLDPGFTAAWKAEAKVEAFREAQRVERDRVYFDPAVRLAKLDGLGTLGQFVYYDAMVFHGPDTTENGFYELRERALAEADTPAEGGTEEHYLDVFLDMHRRAIEEKRLDHDTSRVDTALRKFLAEGNLDLDTPLRWTIYGQTYRI
ncbi:chitosanase [Streptomyces sp. NBC_01216]|uniref:chitosanase n=1 Tax=Streptomyces sp. NBC_01216 TaxID=2903778 RepID=UPI002E0E31AC|nr:chitosanase [Streptomyces sp. NBC_01216]